MVNWNRDSACERASVWMSLELDGELSQVERALLAAHTRRCAACARARQDFDTLTSMVRTTPLEAPARVFSIPVRRRRVTGVRVGAAAALVAVAVGLGSLGASLGRGHDEKKGPQLNVALLTHDDGREFRDLRKGDLVPPAHRFTPPGRLDAV
jgi:ferric-dicitrate binding protein FerR (iron transport regulator)